MLKEISAEIQKDPVIVQFLEGISPVRSYIRGMILFGSRARHDAKPYSDYDILIVLDQKKREIIDVLYDSVMDTLLSSGRLVSLKVFEVSQYEKLRALRTPFMEQVAADGIDLLGFSHG